MSYKNLINVNISLAFKLLKDLAEDGQLVKTTKGSFDFGNMTAASTAATPIPVKVIPTDQNTRSEDRKVKTYNLLFRVAEILTIDRGDKITLLGGTYTINSVIRSNRFIYFVDAVKEGS